MKKFPLELTGEQWHKIHVALLREIPTVDEEILTAVYTTVKESGYLEERNEEIRRNVNIYQRRQEALKRAAQPVVDMKPECTFGYTDEQVTRIMGARLYDFRRYMDGITGTVCDGEEGCGPHGVITYRQDVERYLLGLPVVD